MSLPTSLPPRDPMTNTKKLGLLLLPLVPLSALGLVKVINVISNPAAKVEMVVVCEQPKPPAPMPRLMPPVPAPAHAPHPAPVA